MINICRMELGGLQVAANYDEKYLDLFGSNLFRNADNTSPHRICAIKATLSVKIAEC